MIVEEKEPSTPTTRRSSLRGRESKDEDDDDEEMEEQESTPTSRSRSRRSAALRRSKNEQNDDAEDEHSDIAHKDDSDSNRPIRRVTRNRLNNSVENEAQDDDDEEEEEGDDDEEDVPIGRTRSSRMSSSNEKKSRDQMSISSEPIMHQDGIRRSSRTSKPISRFGKRDLSSEEESDKNTRRSCKYIYNIFTLYKKSEIEIN